MEQQGKRVRMLWVKIKSRPIMGMLNNGMCFLKGVYVDQAGN